jgi:nucleotide sugar dehydrogenase
MSSPIMQARTEDIDSAEKRARCAVSVIGCGKAGLLQAILFADAGFRVICVDTDQTVVNNIAKGKTSILDPESEAKLRTHAKAQRLRATTDFKEAISQSDITVITTPVKIDAKRRANYSNIENVCKRTGSDLHSGSLIIVTSLTGVGVVEGLITETLENTSGLKAGNDFGLAYSPFKTFHSQTLQTARDHQRIVAATDKNTLRVASIILESIMKKKVLKTEDVKTAQVAALFEVMQRDVRIALASESAFFCEKSGTDYLEAHKLAEGDSGDATGVHILPDDSVQEEPYILLEEAENLNLRLRVPSAARDANRETVKHIANLVKDALKNCGKTIRRARISILGVSQTPNTKGPPNRTAKDIADTLEAKGARVSLYDPYLSKNETPDVPFNFKRNISESAQGADCVIILTAHEQFKRLNLRRMKLIMKMPAAIIDLQGIVEPGKIEKEGFVYRGLGRGVWTK